MKLSDAGNKTSGQIKNIIFDWGGVITNINYQATIDAFKKYGLDDFDKLYTKFNQSELFIQLETGKITAFAFRQELRKSIGIPVSDEEIDKAWSAMLLDTPADRLELLRQLKERYRTFLLSNTNSIHVEGYRRYLHAVTGISDFNELFEKVYYSHEAGYRKPGKEIFEYVLSDCSVKPVETLFVDDTCDNIETAESLGIKTLHINDGMDIADCFKQAGYF